MPYVANQEASIHKVISVSKDPDTGKEVYVVEAKILEVGESIADDELAPYQKDSPLLDKVSESKADKVAADKADADAKASDDSVEKAGPVREKVSAVKGKNDDVSVVVSGPEVKKDKSEN